MAQTAARIVNSMVPLVIPVVAYLRAFFLTRHNLALATFWRKIVFCKRRPIRGLGRQTPKKPGGRPAGRLRF
jgi:hypothetical protein